MQALVWLGRGVHVAAVLSVFGALLVRTLVAPPALADADLETRQLVERRLARLAWIGTLLALISGAIWLAIETADMAEASTLGQVLAGLLPVAQQTRFGRLLLLRIGLLLVAVLCLGSGHSQTRSIITCIPSGASVATQAWMGHAAAIGGAAGFEVATTETLHLLAAAAWLGGLVPLLLTIRTLAPAQAAIAARRFSPLGMASVLILAATAPVQGAALIGSIPAMIGTAYGRIDLFKLLVFALLIAIALVNRLRFTEALVGPHPRGAHRRLGASIAFEAALGLIVVLAAGLMASQLPGIHASPRWPFAMRPSLVSLSDPALRREVVIGLVAAGIGVAAVAVAIFWRRGRWLLFGAGALAMIVGLQHARPMLIPTYPTTFYRSPTGFSALSIANGARIFAARCAACHGPSGQGNGPLAGALPVRPADLTAAHFRAHTEGDLFWFATEGFTASNGSVAMPGFARVLSENERWNVIDFLLANNAGATVRTSGAWATPVAAPDFAARCAEARLLLLSDLRGQVVRLIAETEAVAGVEPTRGGANPTTLLLFRDMGHRVRGNACIADAPPVWAAYSLVAGLAPENLGGSEFLVDANGWLRGYWRSAHASGLGDPNALEAKIREIRAHPLPLESSSTGGHVH